MKRLLLLAVVPFLLSPPVAAQPPSCVPPHVYLTPEAGWVSLLLLPPVLVLNVVGAAVPHPVPYSGQQPYLDSLHCSTLAMYGHAYYWKKNRVQIQPVAYTTRHSVLNKPTTYSGNWVNAGKL
jgi:hypothetical protein